MGVAAPWRSCLKFWILPPAIRFFQQAIYPPKGEDSEGVHSQLLSLEQRGVNVVVLLGNHELMLLAMQRMIGADVDLSAFPASAFHGADVSFLMRENETWATIKSYGLEGANDSELWAFRNDDPLRHFEKVSQRLKTIDWKLPQPHLDFLSRCKMHHVERNCFFVHSGIRPAHLQMDNVHRAIDAQLEEDARELCWNREAMGHTPGFPELVVHGHTPLFYLHSYVPDTIPWRDDDLVFKSAIHNGSLNLDSGVFLEAGPLSAVEIPEDGCTSEFDFIRVPRLDPVCKDRLWHLNHM